MALVAVVGLVAIAVTDDGDGPSTAPPGIDIADLEPALLTVDDVGGGYAIAEADDEDDAPSSEEVDTSPECRQVLESFGTFEPSDAEEDLEAEFERADEATVSHEIALIDADEPTFGEVFDGLRRCGTIAYEEQGTHTEIQMDAAELDGIAHEAIGVDMTLDLTSPSYSLTLDAYLVISERGGIASVVFVTGPLDVRLQGGPADRELARRLAETSDERIRRVLED